MDDEQKSLENAQTEADGYYGEDELDNEELDLSFLDEEEAKADEPADDKRAG